MCFCTWPGHWSAGTSCSLLTAVLARCIWSALLPAAPPAGCAAAVRGLPPNCSLALHCCAAPLLQVPESAEDGPDLERFLQAATPQVLPPPSGLQDLTMVSAWRGPARHLLRSACMVEPLSERGARVKGLCVWHACINRLSVP